MAFQKKTWTDRLVEFPGRRLLKIISQSATEIVVDVFRNEGNISREGDPYSATNMNDLEQRIEDEFTRLYSEIDFKTLLVGQQVRPDKLNTLIDVDITDLYNKRMSGKKSIYEVPYISYIENPVQMCWYYYIGNGRKIFRYAVTRESDLHSAINLNLAILYRDIS